MRLCLTLLVAAMLAACANDTYAPVSDRTPRAGGQSSHGHYVVARGDTLFSIAFRHGVDHRNLGRWNGISEPYTIYPGQRLRLSAPSSEGSRQTSTPARSASRPSGSTSRTPATPPRPQSPPPGRSDGWAWPASGEVLKRFSADADGKQGINIGGRDGADVKAAAAGRVVYSGSGLMGYGNLIILRHEGEYLTAYGYNREMLVDEGEVVRKGDTIARMGRNEGRPMLHFELRKDGRAIDPLDHLPAR